MLCDTYLAKLLEKYYLIHMKLMRDWGEYNDKEVRFGDNPNLFCHLPESLISDMIDTFTEIIQLNPKGIKIF